MKSKKRSGKNSHIELSNDNLISAKKWKMRPLALAVLCASGAAATNGYAQDEASGSYKGTLEEIIVTATRRNESTQDIPYNISAVTSDTLENSGVAGLGDIARIVPGISFVDQGPVSRGQKNNLVLRGINSSAATNNRGNGDESVATVSTYLGETPVFFSLTTKDLERVEVLRGPQGTVYGSGAVGGTIRFIPKKPDLENGFSVVIDGQGSVTEDSDESNYGSDIIVNLPINDQFGLRLAGGSKQDGGFVDALGLVRRDANGAASRRPGDDAYGGYDLLPRQEDINDSESTWLRLTGLWNVNEDVEVLLRYQGEKTEQDSQQWSRSGFPGGIIDSSAALVSGNVIDNKGGCPNNGVASDIFGFDILYPCYGADENSAYPNGATQYPAAGRNEHLLPLLEPYEETLDLFAVEVNADLGFASLTSATSYYETQEDTERETTGFLESALAPGASSLASAYAYFPRMLILDDYTNNAESFSQEFRLVSTWDKKWNYVVGAYYRKLEETSTQESPWPGISDFCSEAGVSTPVGASAPGVGCVGYPGFAGANPQLGDLTFTNDSVEEFTDKAIFGELSFDITDQWQVTGGFRTFKQEYSVYTVQTFPFCGSSCGTGPLGTAIKAGFQDSNETIFKLNSSYDLDEDTLIYATWAEGFRRGGSNSAPIAGNQASSITDYVPDEAVNYELGIKGTLNDRFQYTLAAYRVDWEQFQTGFYTAFGFGSTTNGGDATSQGLEFELSGQLSEELSFNLGYTFTDAEVTETIEIVDLLGSGLLPLRIIENGSALPSVPENTFTINADYEHVLSSGANLSWNVNGSFRGETQADFDPITIASFDMDSFWMWNAAVTLDTNDSWSTRLFVRNMFDEEGITGGLPPGFSSDKSSGFYVARPRTMGLGFKYTFK